MTYLKFARLQKGWTQDQLSKLVYIHQPLLSMMENGMLIGGPGQRERLAKALDVPVDKLFEEVPSPVEIAALQGSGK